MPRKIEILQKCFLDDATNVQMFELLKLLSL